MPGDSSDRKRRIFISYRRRVGAPSAELLFERLAKRLGDGIIFYDVADIEPGEPFPQRLRDALKECEIVLAVIDPEWVGERYQGGPLQGQRRLHDPNDWVRIELETALTDSKLLVPLLAYHDKLPPAADLPESLRRLATLQVQKLHQGKDGQHDFEQLAQFLASKLRITLRCALPPVFSVLPRRNPYFTGRDKELCELAERLTTDGIAVLSGLGGMGKTGTALEYAYRHAAEYRVVFWTTADTESNLFAGLVRLAHELDLPQKDAQDQNVAVQAAQRWLAENDGWLLILDNADTDEAIKAIGKLLPSKTGTMERRETGSGVDFRDAKACSDSQTVLSRKSTPDPFARGGHVLITSRRSNVSRLRVTHPIEIAKLDPNDAHDFLRHRTGRDDIAGDELDALVNLAEEVGYAPLALEQAAAYIIDRGVRFVDYLTCYKQGDARLRLELLNKMPPEMGDREKRLLAVTWLLNFEEIEQESPASADLLRFFALLGADDIPFELIALGAAELGKNVASALRGKENDPIAVPDLLAPLRRYSLIDVDTEARTLSIHRLVQMVAQVSLDDREHRKVVERTLAALTVAFPEPTLETWDTCDRLAEHVWAARQSTPEGRVAARRFRDLGCRCAEFQGSRSLLQRVTPLLDYLSERYGNTPRGRQCHDAIALHKRGFLLQACDQLEEAERWHRQGLAISEAAFGTFHPMTAMSLNCVAKYCVQCGDDDAADRAIDRVVEMTDRVAPVDTDILADILALFAKCYIIFGAPTPASRPWTLNSIPRRLYQTALELRERTWGASHLRLAPALGDLAHFHSCTGQHADAERVLLRSLAIREQHLGVDHPEVAWNVASLANEYAANHCDAEAAPLYERALGVLESVLSTDAQERLPLAWVYFRLAGVYYRQQRVEAETFYRRALQTWEDAAWPLDPNVAECLYELACLYCEGERYAEAEACARPAVGGWARCNRRTIDVARSLLTLAETYRGQGRSAAAERLLVRSLAIREEQLGPEDLMVATALTSLARLFEEQRRYTEAEPLFRCALEIRLKSLPVEHADMIASIHDYAAILRQLGRQEDAAALQRACVETLEVSSVPYRNNRRVGPLGCAALGARVSHWRPNVLGGFLGR